MQFVRNVALSYSSKITEDIEDLRTLSSADTGSSEDGTGMQGLHFEITDESMSFSNHGQ